MPTHPRQYNRLLLPEPPLQVIPSLAVIVGLNEAIFLQQLHYWLQSKSAKPRDGRVWIYNTYEEWHTQMPFWSERTIQRIVLNLVEKKLVVTTQQHNTSKMDKTNWYALDYDELARLTDSDDHDDKLSSSGRQVDEMEDDSLAPSLKEQETTQEINNRDNGSKKSNRHLTIEELQEAERKHQEIERWTHPERFRNKKSR